MTRTTRTLMGAIGMLLALGGAAMAGVDVHIGIPAPPSIVVEAPPRLVVVPGVPAVQYAPDVTFNYFAYGRQYYTFHDGAWFVASGYGGPWTYVEPARVPHPVLVVPVRYYREPPHGHWHGHPHGMPPGQAKKLYGNEHHHHGHDDD